MNSWSGVEKLDSWLFEVNGITRLRWYRGGDPRVGAAGWFLVVWIQLTSATCAGLGQHIVVSRLANGSNLSPVGLIVHCSCCRSPRLDSVNRQA
jgi:hypothetical protein